jgi:uncharacterized repeat protein (TIGR01451 family)
VTGRKRTGLATFVAGVVATVSALQTFVPAAASGSISVVDYSQCANGAPGTVTTPPNACTGWINGDLNAQNSQYHEDQVVPQRVEVSLGKTNTVTDHTITLQYLARKGSANAHAYDSLATWNFTIAAADRCQGLSAAQCVGGTASTIPIPADPTSVPPIGPGGNGSAVTSTHQLSGQVFTMYGGSLTSVSSYTHSAAAQAGTDDNVNVTVHYTAKAGATVQLLFGGHLAAESGPRGWGTGLGAASINGGPYHISLVNADGVSIGSKDNNIQSSAILGQPSLSITKTADSSTVNAGGQVGFTITVTNNGGASASGVTVTDNLPNTGSAWTMSPSVSGCTISGATSSQVLSCSLTIAANSSVAIHVVSIAANPASCGTLSNTASFSGGGSSGSAGPVSVTVTCPALKVTKTPDAASVSSGQNIGFTITVTNTGNGTATNVTLNDPLPTGTGLNWSINPAYTGPGTCSISGTAPAQQTLTCSFGNLAAGGSVSVHVTSTTTSATSGTFNNTATAQATNSPPASGSGSETVNPPGLHVTKTPDAASVSSGSAIGFTITVSNTGTGTALGVTLNDPLPTGTGLNWSISPAYTGPGTCSISGAAPAQQTLTCSFGNLASGASVSVHVTSPTTSATSGTFTNTATAQGTNTPPTSGSGSETVLQPSLHVTKTPDAASVSSGSPIGFTVTVSNSGPGTATSVTLNDPLPTGTGLNWSINPAYTGPGTCSISGTAPAQQTLTCSFGNLASGASVSVHVTSPTTAGTSGTFTNTATAQGTNTPPTSGSGSETVNQPSLQVTKTPDAASVSSGSPIGFTITVSNNGAGTATSVTLNDPLPVASGLNWSINPAYTGPGTCTITGTAPAQQTLTCSFGDLASGASVSVHVTSPTTADTSGVIANTATAQGTNTPPTSGSGSETVLQPSLHISKTPDQGSVSSGDSIGYTIIVSNSGPGTASGVTVSDTLPNNAGLNWTLDPAVDGCSITGSNPQVLSCTFASLAPNSSVTIHVVSPTTAATCGTVNNTASVSATNSGGSIVTQTASITVNCPDVHIAKTADSGTVNAGSQIGYTITVTNLGAGTATNVTVSDTLPNNPGLNWSMSPAVSGCTISGSNPQVLSCAFASIAPGASISIHVVSPTTAQSCGTVSNVASETTGNDGSATTPNAVVITVNCAVLTVSKVSCPVASVPPGGLLTYTISYGNTGAAPATSVVLVDTLPAGTQVANAGGGTVGSGTVTWNIGTLAAGASGSKTLILLVTAASGTTLVNTATLSSPDAAASATTTVSTLVSNAGAITHGGAYGLEVNALGTEIVDHFGQINTVAPGSPSTAASQLAVIPVPGIVTATLVRQESNSAITNEAQSTASSTVVGLNLLSGAITADAVSGISQSTASPFTATYDSTGSNFVNLVVQGQHGPVALANVAPNTSVTVYNPLLPTQKLASVVLYEESGSASLSSGLWHSSHTLNMIDVNLLVPFMGLPSGATIVVAHANSDATYPSGLACGTQPSTVSGKAFTAFANGTLGNNTVANVQVGDAELPAFGGSNSDQILGVDIPGFVTTLTGSNATSGSTSSTPNATASSVVHSTNLLGGLITADLLDVSSTSSATGNKASTTFGSTCGVDACATGCSSSSPCFVNLAVNGTSIVGINGGTIKPNTTIAIPEPDGSLVLVILNEQLTSSDGSKNTEGTVNAIHVWVLQNSGIVSAEVIVASAHSDAHHS